MTASGYTGTAEFDGATVVITNNWRGKVTAGKEPRILPVSKIERVEFQPATMLSNGTIRFVVPGESNPDVSLDKNKVIFTRKQASDFESLKDAVMGIISARSDTERDEFNERVANEAADAAAAQRARTRLIYDKHQVFAGMYQSVGMATAKSISGAEAEFDSGADTSRPTLTRIGAGALLAGPIGAVGGALLKKNTTKAYVTIVFADGDTVIIEGPIKDEMKMRQFAADFNRLAAN